MVKLTNGQTFNHCFCYMTEGEKCSHPDCTGGKPVKTYRINMKQAVCSVFDKKTATFHSPFTVRHPGEAIREWDVVRKNPETKFGKHPEDFDLMQIGWYDDTLGTVENLKPHTHLASGV